ncbi:MAG: hypothetical protein COY40_01795 [Alphaproteobacteria bacterium CG_4_10_14_0_8_um_filter_53_9]|nr:MAG: hypothetical protein COY40_01795 [Alphaproteobacteria bacterium CG_4_10_14_0_8_um_filter_53_9]
MGLRRMGIDKGQGIIHIDTGTSTYHFIEIKGRDGGSVYALSTKQQLGYGITPMSRPPSVAAAQTPTPQAVPQTNTNSLLDSYADLKKSQMRHMEQSDSTLILLLAIMGGTAWYLATRRPHTKRVTARYRG